MKRFMLLMLLSPLAHAELSAEAVLNQAFPNYDKQHQCWIAKNADQQNYCLKLDHKATVGERLYVLAAGDYQDAQGENTASHADSGLVAAFVAEEKDGKLNILHSNTQINAGSTGIAPTNWTFVKLGADDYWGWYNESGWMGQGYTTNALVILAPKDNGIAELTGGFMTYMDDYGVCTEGEKGCSPRTEISAKLDVVGSSEKVFPLRFVVTGKDKGKNLGRKIWTVPFDEKTWTYPVPNNWILKDKI